MIALTQPLRRTIVGSIKNIKKNDTLTIKLKDGEVTSKIIKVGE